MDCRLGRPWRPGPSYRLGIDGGLFGASLPGAGLVLLGGAGAVGGDAEGVRSRVGFSPTRFESQAAASPVSSTNAHSPERSLFMISPIP
ncbi:MAG TPA: hypothetical protein VKG20_14245 [Methylomirabilota bacterium]|nr:hypothetical protein [Methylomirabilota bacterium]